MKDKKALKIDFGSARLGKLADQLYNEGKYISALRMTYKQLDLYGGDGDVYARLADIYEGMGLQGTAINWWFRFLDVAEAEDLPDIYEGIAVNFLNMGNESASAFYYNKLIDADDSLPDETKMDIVDAFAVDKRAAFRFVYPPELADYSKEISVAAKALKAGNFERVLREVDKVAKGSKDYVKAMEMKAVTQLLAGQTDEAEKTCLSLLDVESDDLRGKATLAAVYLEQGRKEDCLKLALELAESNPENPDDLYKIATVCCENELHEAAYEKFCVLDKKLPYDGRMLYFKAVSAYKSGKIKEAEQALDTLCSIYPDAEVAKYYLRAIRAYLDGETPAPELIYFYHLPQQEREDRCRTLISLGSLPLEEAQIFGNIAWQDGYFRWCFDEMDGGDQDLQYLALVTAVHTQADEFLRDVFLDYEVPDVLKIETLRLLYERNQDEEYGIVLCNVYRRVRVMRIKIGRKKRKKFLEAYAKLASKFAVLDDRYAQNMKRVAERFYADMQNNGGFDLIDNSDDCACALFLLSGVRELGGDETRIAEAFGADLERVKKLLYAVKE